MGRLDDMVIALTAIKDATEKTVPKVDNLAKAERVLRDELIAVAKGLPAVTIGLNAARAAFLAEHEATKRANIEHQKLLGTYDELGEKTKELKNLHKELQREMRAGGAGVAALTAKINLLSGEVKTLTEDDNKAAAAMKRLEDEMKGVNANTKAMKETMESLSKGVKSAIGGFTRLIGTLGVTSLSFRDIATVGAKYNASMFDILKTQNALGVGLKDIDGAMEIVGKTTNLSKIQFADFAQTVTGGMIGVRMSLEEVAELSSTLSKIAGPSFAAQKKGAQDLAAIQSQFPSLYKEIRRGMDLVVKIKETGGTSADKAELAAMREKITLTQQQAGMSSQSQAETRKMLTEVTAEMDKQNETERKQQELEQQIDDAKIKFFQSIQPLMKTVLTMTTDFVNVIKDMTNGWTISAAAAIGGLTLIASNIGTVTKSISKMKALWTVSMAGIRGGIAGMRAALISMNAAAWMSPYILIGAAIIATIAAVAIGVKGVMVHQQRANKAVEESIKLKKEEASLTTNQRAGYEKLNKELDLSGKTEEEINAMKLKNLAVAKDQSSEQGNLQVQQELVNKEMESMLNLISKSTGGYKTLVDTAAKFGMVNEQALQSLINMAHASADVAKTGLAKQIKALQENKSFSLKVDVNMDIEGQANSVLDQLNAQYEAVKNIVGEEQKRASIMAAIAAISGAQKVVAEKTAEVTSSEYEKDSARVKQMEDMTSKAEARLQTETKVYEASARGLGVSIKMQAKQADLAYRMKATYDDAIKQMQERLIGEGALTAAQIRAVENAETQEDAERMIAQWTKAGSQEQSDANQYYGKYQELSKKSMDQQLKIYEITKNVREGYLDAIREMSVGGGEFEKIIGTQEMGVTQLMDTIHKATGEWKGNTLKLGGMGQDTQGATPTLQYTAGGGTPGIAGIGPQTSAAQMNRLYNPTNIGSPTVGSAAAASRDVHGQNYINANRQATDSQTNEINEGQMKSAKYIVNGLSGVIQNANVLRSQGKTLGGYEEGGNAGGQFANDAARAMGAQNAPNRAGYMIPQSSQSQAARASNNTQAQSGGGQKAVSYSQKAGEFESAQAGLQDAVKGLESLEGKMKDLGDSPKLALTRGELQKQIDEQAKKVSQKGKEVKDLRGEMRSMDKTITSMGGMKGEFSMTPHPERFLSPAGGTPKLDLLVAQLEDAKKYQRSLKDTKKSSEMTTEERSKSIHEFAKSKKIDVGDINVDEWEKWRQGGSENGKAEQELAAKRISSIEKDINAEKDRLLSSQAIATESNKQSFLEAARTAAYEKATEEARKRADEEESARKKKAADEKEAAKKRKEEDKIKHDQAVKDSAAAKQRAKTLYEERKHEKEKQRSHEKEERKQRGEANKKRRENEHKTSKGQEKSLSEKYNQEAKSGVMEFSKVTAHKGVTPLGEKAGLSFGSKKGIKSIGRDAAMSGSYERNKTISNREASDAFVAKGLLAAASVTGPRDEKAAADAKRLKGIKEDLMDKSGKRGAAYAASDVGKAKEAEKSSPKAVAEAAEKAYEEQENARYKADMAEAAKRDEQRAKDNAAKEDERKKLNESIKNLPAPVDKRGEMSKKAEADKAAATVKASENVAGQKATTKSLDQVRQESHDADVQKEAALGSMGDSAGKVVVEVTTKDPHLMTKIVSTVGVVATATENARSARGAN